MRGEALPKETHPEPPHAGQHDERALFDLTLFASILLRRPFDALGEDDATIVRFAAAEAARSRRNGRADAVSSDVLAYRIVYRALREQAAEAGPLELAERGPRWEKVLRATCMLRHRQRAVLAAYYCAGMDLADAGRVVRASEAQARAVIGSAVSGVAKMLGEPVDVRRSLRMAAGRMAARAAAATAEAQQPVVAIERPEPRAVMRNWVAPSWPLDGTAALQPAAGLGPVGTLLAPVGVPGRVEVSPQEHAPARPVSPPRPVPTRPVVPARDIVPLVRPKPDRRPLFAAAAALLVLAVLVPGIAVEPAGAPPADPVLQPEPVSVMEMAPPIETLAPRAIRVRRGDSLWALATVHLGDGARWRAIWRLNRGEVMVSGHRFTQPGLIRPGWVLRLPERARV